MSDCMEELKNIKKKVVSTLAEEMDSLSLSELDTAINIMHHVAEAERNCAETCYYKSVVEAMKSKSDEHSESEEHVARTMPDTIATIRDIWKHASTDNKKKIKADINSLLSEMTV